MKKLEFVAKDWVNKNERKIVENIYSKHTLLNDEDASRILSRFKYNENIDELPYILFTEISNKVVNECVEKSLDLELFIKAINRVATFSCLSDYTTVYKEDLLEEFSHKLYNLVFEKEDREILIERRG